MNITDVIWRNMRAWPGRAALIQNGQAISYGSLQATVERLASRLASLGIGSGDCVGVSCKRPSANLSLVLALARMGAVSTPINTNSPQEILDQLVRRHKTVAWLKDDGEARVLTGIAPDRQVTVSALFRDLDAEPSFDPSASPVSDEQAWRIGLSSGTTGTPKGILWTHRAGALLQALSLGTYECRAGSRLFVFSDIGIGLAIGHSMMQLAGGGTVIFPGHAAPEEFFQVLQRDQPTSVLSSTALVSAAIAHLEALPAGTVTIPASLRSITLGGSVVPPVLAAAIREHLCPNLQISYGSTETGTMALADAATLDANPHAAGRLMPWIEAQAVDANARPLPAGQSGTLRFRSPAMASGYVDDPQASATAFRDGWYYPGDTGAIDDKGLLLLGGRTDHLVNLQGIKLDPARVEQVLHSHPAVREAGVVAVTVEQDKPLLVAVVVTRTEVNADVLLKMCRDRLGAPASPRMIVMARALPRTLMGKLDRSALAGQVATHLRSRPKQNLS